MDVVGTTPRMGDDSRDAYTEVGGRATQEAKAEGGGSERLEHVLEVELRRDDCMDAGGSECREHILEQQPRATHD